MSTTAAPGTEMTERIDILGHSFSVTGTKTSAHGRDVTTNVSVSLDLVVDPALNDSEVVKWAKPGQNQRVPDNVKVLLEGYIRGTGYAGPINFWYYRASQIPK